MDTTTHMSALDKIALQRLECKGNIYPTLKEIKMEASGIMRKLKELDALEKRLRQTVNPSKVLLDQIKAEREALLNPRQEVIKG